MKSKYVTAFLVFFAVLAIIACGSRWFNPPSKENWTVTRVLDGDTVEVDAVFYPKELGQIQIRVMGVDTPESGHRAKCTAERERAKAAKQFAVDTLLNRQIVVSQIKADKYGGRIVADVHVEGKLYRAMLLDRQLARMYDGGTKQSWCN